MIMEQSKQTACAYHVIWERFTKLFRGKCIDMFLATPDWFMKEQRVVFSKLPKCQMCISLTWSQNDLQA